MLVDSSKEEIELSFMAIERNDDGTNTMNVMNLETFAWEGKGIAPDNFDDIANHALEIHVKKNVSYPKKVVMQCPLCWNKFSLGLSEEEFEGYNRYRCEDEDLEDAIPALNLFEKEFLLTGMCPNCQCEVFKKSLPTDISRWSIVE